MLISIKYHFFEIYLELLAEVQMNICFFSCIIATFLKIFDISN